MSKFYDEDIFNENLGCEYISEDVVEPHITLSDNIPILCSYCHKNRTDMYYNGKAICVDCLCALSSKTP